MELQSFLYRGKYPMQARNEGVSQKRVIGSTFPKEEKDFYEMQG